MQPLDYIVAAIGVVALVNSVLASWALGEWWPLALCLTLTWLSMHLSKSNRQLREQIEYYEELENEL